MQEKLLPCWHHCTKKKPVLHFYEAQSNICVLAKYSAVSFTMENKRLLQPECTGGAVKTTQLTADKHSGTTGLPCDAFRECYFTSESSFFHVTAALGNWRPLKVHVIIRVGLERRVEERRVERRRLKVREGQRMCHMLEMHLLPIVSLLLFILCQKTASLALLLHFSSSCLHISSATCPFSEPVGRQTCPFMATVHPNPWCFWHEEAVDKSPATLPHRCCVQQHTAALHHLPCLCHLPLLCVRRHVHIASWVLICCTRVVTWRGRHGS